MGESVTVSARLPRDYRQRLEAILAGRSLGAWLQEVVDGLERVDDLEARAKALEETIADREGRARELEEKLERQRSTLDRLRHLREAGISPEQLAKWATVLSHAGTRVDDLEADLGRYSSLAAACRELEKREKRLRASVEALEERMGVLRDTVAVLKDTTTSAIAELKETCIKELETAGAEMGRKIKEYGEACRLSEVLRRDLPLAAVLHAMGQPELAPEVQAISALTVLDRVRRWSEATGTNLKSRPPARVTGGNWLYAGWELGLYDLVLWAAATLIPLCEDGAKAGEAAG